MTLNEFFAAHPKCALGFSGGVDSAYLLYAGVRAGADIRPYYVKTAFQPRFEQDDALRLAGELGVEVTVLELDALADPRVAANPAERCYYCKQNLFRALKARAAADGYAVLLDGTNASDEAGFGRAAAFLFAKAVKAGGRYFYLGRCGGNMLQ